MLVMLQAYQVLNGLQYNPIFEILMIFNDIESDVNEGLFHDISMD